MTSQWAPWRPKPPASRVFSWPFAQAHIKENIKALRHWPVWGESTGFPSQRASNAENVSIWWRRHVYGSRFMLSCIPFYSLFISVTSLAPGQSYDCPVPVMQPWNIWVTGISLAMRPANERRCSLTGWAHTYRLIPGVDAVGAFRKLVLGNPII